MDTIKFDYSNLLDKGNVPLEKGKYYLASKKYISAIEAFDQVLIIYNQAMDSFNASLQLAHLTISERDRQKKIIIDKTFLTLCLKGNAHLEHLKEIINYKLDDESSLTHDKMNVSEDSPLSNESSNHISAAIGLYRKALKLIEDEKYESILEKNAYIIAKFRLAKCLLLQGGDVNALEALKMLEELSKHSLEHVESNVARKICINLGKSYYGLNRKLEALFAFLESKYEYNIELDNDHAKIDRLIADTFIEIKSSKLNHNITINDDVDDKPVEMAPSPHLIYQDPLILRAGGLFVIGCYFYINGLSHINITMFSVSGFTAADCLAFTAIGFLAEPWIMDSGKYAIEHTPEYIKQFIENCKNNTIQLAERN